MAMVTYTSKSDSITNPSFESSPVDAASTMIAVRPRFAAARPLNLTTLCLASRSLSGTGKIDSAWSLKWL